MIKENIFRIKESIPDAPGVTIVAVTKGRTTAQIREALAAGILDIGENRIQEAAGKHRELADLRDIRWHMVGHLQTNKAKEAVRIFDLIHSVDSKHLAEEIDKQAQKIGKVQDILIEVNTSGEEAKFGIRPEGLPGLASAALNLKNIRLLGLMTIAPFADDPETTRPYFRALKGLLDGINVSSAIERRLAVLSMGMTGDFRVAIEEGATMVRLGRAIFED